MKLKELPKNRTSMQLNFMPKKIVKRLIKKCSVCGKAMRVIVYSKKDYRGGHFFGKIPLCTKKEEARARSFGTRPWKFAGRVWQVYKKDPKPYAYAEYWECPGCYWEK